MAAGTKTLYDGVNTLNTGAGQLNDGAGQLNDGLNQFNEEGISPLTGALDQGSAPWPEDRAGQG